MLGTTTTPSKELRQRAEDKLNVNESATPDQLSPDEKRLFHELQVHQIELEMQNEALQLRNNQLAQYQDHLINIIKMTPAGYFRIDIDGRILEVNDSWLCMHGYESADEVIGKNYSIMQLDSGSDSALRHMAELKGGKAVPAGEFISMRKDGSFGHHTFSAHPIIRCDDVVGFEWFIIDITDRIRAENETKKKNEELERFVYTVSHDLRSPLVTIKTFMGYLEKDIAEGKQVDLAKDIEFIQAAADKMKLLLDELVDLSRADQLGTPAIMVSLREVLADTLLVLGAGIRERQVDIRLPVTDLVLFGDLQHLSQIWQNLIENAIKYSRDGSIPVIEPGIQQGSGETIFFVKDNGIGIEPQYLSKIFGLFEKLDPKSPGAGLGLSLVQRIVEKSGGRVWAESEGNGKGSCFYFTLPKMMVPS
jgi:PAS domain S-box-containing protein